MVFLIAQDKSAFLKHYGVKRRSGRYPWGSGQNPQAARDFLADVELLRSQGLSDVQIVEGLGLNSTTELRDLKTIAKNARKMDDIAKAEALRAKG